VRAPERRRERLAQLLTAHRPLPPVGRDRADDLGGRGRRAGRLARVDERVRAVLAEERAQLHYPGRADGREVDERIAVGRPLAADPELDVRELAHARAGRRAENRLEQAPRDGNLEPARGADGG
jgi:hypothetical protein